MSYGIGTYDMSDLQALKSRAGAKIAGAIETASAKTGVDFSYLLQQAHVESSFDPKAKAGTSSATGLFQFIESTWMSMVKKYGDKYGLSNMANQIGENGKVADSSIRQQILDLRKDPKIAALMAGEFAAENKDYLEKTVSGDVGSTELYLAHFMGAGGASKFIKALQKNPQASCAALFPGEACSNKNVFYTKSGKPKSLAEVYAFFDSKFRIDTTATDTSTPEMPLATIAAGEDQTVTATTAKQQSARVNLYHEAQKQWIRTYSPELYTLTSASTKSANGGIPGLQPLVVNPVDLMTLVELTRPSHINQSRYNA
jgi:hypothetical protein